MATKIEEITLSGTGGNIFVLTFLKEELNFSLGKKKLYYIIKNKNEIEDKFLELNSESIVIDNTWFDTPLNLTREQFEVILENRDDVIAFLNKNFYSEKPDNLQLELSKLKLDNKNKDDLIKELQDEIASLKFQLRKMKESKSKSDPKSPDKSITAFREMIMGKTNKNNLN